MGVHYRMLGVVAAVALMGGCGGSSHDSMSHGSEAGTKSDSASGAVRTVDVTMRDIMYDPPAVTVKDGETVTFVFHNAGKIPHDAFLGDEAAQTEHEKKMMGGPSMGGHMDDDAITVQPGLQGSITHTFKAGDALVIGCHQAGHYAAGMTLAVVVS